MNMSHAPDEPRTAMLVVENVFFSSRLRDTLKHLGYGAVSARSVPDIETALGAGPVALVIVDLAISTLDAAALVHRLKAGAATRQVPVIAFGGHLDVERLEAAAQAGADRVVTNGQISANLPGILGSLGLAAASGAAPA